MLSKNNFKERLRKMEPKKERFSIRKFTVGVASVLIGFSIFGMSSQSVKADTDTDKGKTEPVSEDKNIETNKDQSDVVESVNQEAGKQEVAKVSQDIDKLKDSRLSLSDAKAAAAKTQTKIDNLTAEQKAELASQRGTVDSKKDDVKVDQNQTAEAKIAQKQDKEKLSVDESVVKANKSIVPPKDVQAKLHNKYNRLAPATATQTETAENWEQLANALNNGQVGTINITGDITVDNNTSNAITKPNPLVAPGKLQLTGKDISRTVTINGGGHTIDFGDNYLTFTTDGPTGAVKGNRDKDHPWNITFNDVTINSNVGVPFGLIGNSHASGANQYDTVTYNNVKANIKKDALIDSTNVNVVFTGNNDITASDVGSSATITAHTVHVINGTTNFNTSSSFRNSNALLTSDVGSNTICVQAPSDNNTSVVTIDEGATLNIKTGSTDVRGIVTSDFQSGTVTVNGTLNEDLQDGRSDAIVAGNLIINKSGSVDIKTKQDNNGGTSWTDGNGQYNGYHYGVITLGAGLALSSTNLTTGNTLTDNGSLKIVRGATAKKTYAPLITYGVGNPNGAQTWHFNLNVGEGATLDLQDGSISASTDTSSDHKYNTGLITMFGSGSSKSSNTITITKPAYFNLQRTGQQQGNLYRLEDVNNHFIINGIKGGTPVSQWAAGNYTNIPTYSWRVTDMNAQNNWGNNSFSGFTQQGKTEGQNAAGTTFLNSNGTVKLSMDKVGNVLYKYENGTQSNTNGSPISEVMFNNFLTSYNPWTAQRLSIGSNAIVITPAYDPTTVKQGESKTVMPVIPADGATSGENADQVKVQYSAETGSDATPDWVTVDPSTGKLTLAPTTDTDKGMYNIAVHAKYIDESTGNTVIADKTVYAPVYVTDGHETVTWGKDPNGNYTGAIVVTTDPSALKAHETTANSSVLDPKAAITSIDEYVMSSNHIETTPISINKDSADITTSWDGTTPSTVVADPSNSEELNGTVKVVFGANSKPVKDGILGSDQTTSLSKITIPAAGATAKTPATPVTVEAGSTELSEDNFNALIDHSALDDAGITGYTYAWATAPKAGDTSGVVRITFTDKDAQGNPTYLDIQTPANSIKVHTNETDADKYQPSYDRINVTKGDTKSEDPAWANNQTAPTGTKFEIDNGTNVPTWASIDQNTGKVTVAPDANVPAGDYTVPVKVTYPDTTSETVNVPVTVTDSTPDADKYQPNYDPISVKPGQTNSETPTWTNTDGSSTMPTGTKFEKDTGTTVPDWATVDPTTGEVTVKPGTGVTPGDYKVPVTVTYPDTTSETVTVPVVVTGSKQDDNTVTVYGTQSTVSYTMNTYDTHKTSDGSPMPDIPAPTVQTIVYQNQDKNWNVLSSVTYELQGDNYVAVSATDAQGHTIDPTTVQIFGSAAPTSFAASGVKTAWQQGFGINTSVSNYNGSTGTSTAQSQYNNPDGDQRTTSGDLAGNSKTRVTLSLSGDAASILHNSVADWSNVFGNIYGATTGSTETYKRGQDISGLSQDEFRKLINVTDLGQAGWNGQNINPNAPQVLAYIQGTDNSKKFSMSWAPGHEASTKDVANGVGGMVRISFNDGTYLDIPATINVVDDSNNNKPDDQKTSFTQKIVYQYNGNQVASTEITDIAKGSSLSADQLKNTIDGNVPANYSIDTDNFTYPAAETNITKTPADIIVPLIQSQKQHDDSNYDAQYIIHYYDAMDGNTDPTKAVDGASNKTIDFNKNEGLSGSVIDANVKSGVPANWQIKDGFQLPEGQITVGKDQDQITLNVPLVHKTKDIKPVDPTVDPTDPKYKDMFSDPTRTINVHETDENSAVTHTETQTVWFGREGVEDEVTGKITAKEGAEWKLGKLVNGKFVEDASATDSWAEYTAPEKHGYTAVGSPVAAKDGITANTADITVNITYTDGEPFNFDPTNKDEVKDVTRTITVYKTDGTTQTINQNVHFVRGGTNQVAGYTNPDGSITWTPWTVAKPENGDPNVSTGETNGTWKEYDVPQVNNYTSTVDGQNATKVEEQGVTADTPDANVVVAYTTTKNPTDPDINPNNPGKDSDMFANPTRTINVVDPNTNQVNTTKQTVWYGRTKTVSTDPNAKPTYGDWKVGKVENNKFVEDPNASQTWPEFDAPSFEGYTPSQAKVDSKDVTPSTANETVTITYTKNGGNVTPTPKPQPSDQPTQPQPTAPTQPTTPEKPAEQPTSPVDDGNNEVPEKPAKKSHKKAKKAKKSGYNINGNVHSQDNFGGGRRNNNENANPLGQENPNGVNSGQSGLNKENAKTLPQTGEDDQIGLTLAGLSLSLASVFVGLWFSKSKKRKN